MIESLNTTSAEFLHVLSASSIRLLPLFALVGCGAWLARRRSAATKHHLWLSLIVAALALPAFAAWLPSWTVLPVRQPASEGLDDSASPGTERLAAESTFPSDDVASQVASTVIPPVRPSQSSVSRNVTTITSSGVATSTVLSALWLIVAVGLLSRSVVGQIRLHRSLRATTDPNAETQRAFASLHARLKIRRSVALRISPDDVMPMTWGLLTPVIVLPSSAASWSAERLRMVLLHELGHVRRWDCLTQWASTAARCCYWFHPVVWIAARRLHVERERACDDVVLNAGHVGSDYAAELLDVGTGCRRDALAMCAGIAMSRSSRLQDRVTSILDPTVPRNSPPTWRALSVTATVVICAAAVAALAPAQADDASSRPQAAENERPAKEQSVAENAGPENRLLQGQWRMLSTQFDGYAASFDSGEMDVQISGTTFTQSCAEPARSETNAIEFGDDGRIDFFFGGPGERKRALGRYRLIGNRLWIAVNEDTDDENGVAPTDALPTVPMNGVRYMLLQRVPTEIAEKPDGRSRQVPAESPGDADESSDQDSALNRKIGQAVRRYFEATADRDLDGLQGVLGGRVMAIEAGTANSTAQILDTTNSKEILPPPQNDDWENIQILDLKAERSATHPSVAMASFTLAFPLDDEAVMLREQILAEDSLELDESERAKFATQIKLRAIRNSMFAMLSLQNGQWKIVSITVPK